MKFILRTIITFSLFSSFAHSENVKIVGDDNYLPIIGVQNDQNSGVLIERLNHIQQESGITFKISLFPWSRALNIAQVDDVGIVGISLNKERMKLFDFSLPLFTDSILVLVKKGHEFPFKSFSDLKGKLIGVQKDISLGEDFDEYLKQNKLNINYSLDRKARLKSLINDRLDVVLFGNGKEGLKKVLDEDPELINNKDKIVVLDRPIASDKMYIAFSKKLQKKELIKKINIAIKKLKYENN